MVGQDAVNTAEAFRDGVGFDGVVLTKLDGDARGGAALSVREVTGQPILFASNGEGLDEFDVFHPDRMASRILGMGDVLSLIEQAEQAFDAGQAEAAAKKMGEGDFSLEDFLEQMQSVRKMGPIANILGMLPGAAGMKDQLANVDEKHLDRVQAIIRGMTPAEREDPKIINGSRRLRIANGSGVGRHRRQPARRAVLRGPQDDEEHGGPVRPAAAWAAAGARRPAARARAARRRAGPKSMPAIAGIASESSSGQRSVGSYETPGLNQLPPGLAGLDQLPEGFDPGALTFPGNAGGAAVAEAPAAARRATRSAASRARQVGVLGQPGVAAARWRPGRARRPARSR